MMARMTKETAPPKTDLRITDDEIKRPDFKWTPLDKLTAYHQNARLHSDDQIRLLMHSLKYYGWGSAVAVQKGTNLIIAGHGRVEAAKRLGLKKVPILELDHDEMESRGYRLMDNESMLIGDYDPLMLKTELAELDGAGFEIGLTGFSEERLGDMIDPGGPGAGLDRTKSVTCPECEHTFEI
jgi:hypothetical protein